jgi:hypothetical protein
MKYPRLENHIRKVFACVAVSLILPALAYAGTDKGKGKEGQNNGKQKGRDNFPVVPEVNAGWVLVPFFGAVLFFSAQQLFHRKATEKNDC